MFDQVFDNLQKATEASVKMQQEMVQKWVEGFPKPNAAAATTDAFVGWRKKWEESSADMLKRQKELVDRNYDAGIKALESLFGAAESKSPQEYQQKVTELYRKSFDSLRQLSEAQLEEFKTAWEKWAQVMTTSNS